MAHENLEGLKVAILVDDGFEQVELVEPRKALDQAGAETRVVSPKGERARGWDSPTGVTSCRSMCPSTGPSRTTSTTTSRHSTGPSHALVGDFRSHPR